MKGEKKNTETGGIFLKPSGKPMNEKEIKFVLLAVADPRKEAWQIAKEVGYSHAVYYNQARYWLQDTEKNTKPYLLHTVQKILQKTAEKELIKTEEIINELKNLAFSDATNYFSMLGAEGVSMEDVKKLPENVRRAIKSIKITNTREGQNVHFQLHDKVEALKILAKFTEDYIDRKKIDIDANIEMKVRTYVVPAFENAVKVPTITDSEN